MIPKLNKSSLSNQLIKIMVDQIESGKWQPGTKLPSEIELSSSFNVSRNILRESMKILVNFEILTSKAGIGTFVSENAIANIHNMHFFENLKNNSTIENLLETRLIIEPEMAYYATIRSTDDEINELELEMLNNNIKKHEIANFFYTNDFDFHYKIAQLSRNILCANFIHSILDELKLNDYSKFNKYVDKNIINESLNNHTYLISAMKKRDPLLAKEIMYNHIFSRISIINESYNTDMLLSKKMEKKRLKVKDNSSI